MKHTTNYRLNKPEPHDNVDVDDFNANADTIDAALGRHDAAIDEKLDTADVNSISNSEILQIFNR